MKTLSLVLTALFIQSCYSVIYVTDQYQVTNQDDYVESPPSPAPPPYVPPPPVIYVPVTTPVQQPAPVGPTRERTQGSTRTPVVTPPAGTNTVRERAAVPSTGSGASTGTPAANNPNPQPAQPAARDRTTSQPQQDQAARPRPQ